MRLDPRPDGLFRAAIGDQDIFSVYGASGGLQSRAVAYLIKSGEGEMPISLSRSDLGLPLQSEPFKIFEHERGWKHAAVWIDYAAWPDPPQLDVAAKALNA